MFLCTWRLPSFTPGLVPSHASGSANQNGAGRLIKAPANDVFIMLKDRNRVGRRSNVQKQIMLMLGVGRSAPNVNKMLKTKTAEIRNIKHDLVLDVFPTQLQRVTFVIKSLLT